MRGSIILKRRRRRRRRRNGGEIHKLIEPCSYQLSTYNDNLKKKREKLSHIRRRKYLLTLSHHLESYLLLAIEMVIYFSF